MAQKRPDVFQIRSAIDCFSTNINLPPTRLKRDAGLGVIEANGASNPGFWSLVRRPRQIGLLRGADGANFQLRTNFATTPYRASPPYRRR